MLAFFGTLQLNFGLNPFSEAEWLALDEITVKALEDGTQNHNRLRGAIRVKSYMVDTSRPTPIDSREADRLLALITSGALMQFYREVTGRDSICIRRCQAHVIGVDGHIQPHVDTATNPAYLHAIILQFSDAYTGGEYVVRHPVHGRQVYHLPRFSMLVSTGSLLHEVARVGAGERRTLVYFLAENDDAVAPPDNLAKKA